MVELERDNRGSETFVWVEEQWRSVLDLAIAPKNLSANMEVSQVWDTTQMQHREIFVCAYLRSLDYVLVTGGGGQNG